MHGKTAAGAFICCLALVGCSDNSSTPEPYKGPTTTLAASVLADLNEEELGQLDVGDPCTSGVEEIGPGKPVIVTDAAGATVAQGSFASDGQAVTATDAPETEAPGLCEVPFTVSNFPDTNEFYWVQPGGSCHDKFSVTNIDWSNNPIQFDMVGAVSCGYRR